MRPENEFNGDPAARIARWLDLMRTTDKLLLAGLQRKVGPGGDLNAAYQKWYSDHMRDRDIAVERMARAGIQREPRHAR
jgi:hypothetical protein